LRETQLEKGQKIDGLRQEVRAQGREMRTGFATLGSGMAQITVVLTELTGPDGDAYSH
jgi:hypothetical protein